MQRRFSLTILRHFYEYTTRVFFSFYTRFGGTAVQLLVKGQFGKMVANHPPDLVPVPLGEVVGKTKTVPLDSDLVTTARALGVSFGD